MLSIIKLSRARQVGHNHGSGRRVWEAKNPESSKNVDFAVQGPPEFRHGISAG
jgi:hypothetical protein